MMLVAKVFICGFLFFAIANGKLLYTNVVWRHGDRSPTFSLPSDPDDLWPRGLGQLTNEGIQQEYDLGRFLRSEYKNIHKEYNAKFIYIRSTDVDRTLMSAQASMDGFYRPDANESWHGNTTAWFPVPVHTIPLDQDDLLSYPNTDLCPNYLPTLQKTHQTDWYIKFVEDQKDLFTFLEDKTGVKPVDMTNFYRIQDNFVCKKLHGIPLPKWLTQETYERLDKLQAVSMGLAFTDHERVYHDKLSQMQGGYLVKTIIENIKAKMQNETTYQMIGYSAHDMTLVSLLVAMDAFPWKRPSYGSCIMFDLHKEETGKYFIEVRYRNNSKGSAEVISFRGCDLQCSWDDFLSKANDIIPEDHSKVCGNYEHYSTVYNAKIFFAVLAILLLSCVVCTVAVKKHKNEKTTYEYQPINMT